MAWLLKACTDTVWHVPYGFKLLKLWKVNEENIGISCNHPVIFWAQSKHNQWPNPRQNICYHGYPPCRNISHGANDIAGPLCSISPRSSEMPNPIPFTKPTEASIARHNSHSPMAKSKWRFLYFKIKFSKLLIKSCWVHSVLSVASYFIW